VLLKFSIARIPQKKIKEKLPDDDALFDHQIHEAQLLASEFHLHLKHREHKIF
jgi:hypothetical protein